MGELMNTVLVAKAFNEWMRRSIAEPDKFQREWQVIVEFLREDSGGAPPAYGGICAVYLSTLMAELSANADLSDAMT